MNLESKITAEMCFLSILDVVRQNKYNILKILVKLQVGLKQQDLNMALLHAVKAGLEFLIEISTIFCTCTICKQRNVRNLLQPHMQTLFHTRKQKQKNKYSFSFLKPSGHKVLRIVSEQNDNVIIFCRFSRMRPSSAGERSRSKFYRFKQ